ncbi:MCE family protein [Amycolatopsis anabasis]|uniref:MCE family protein n=1 Tax=Amycolatopsis anabasis TaxID=1840409 RepID=UPI00131C5F82|nr:MCE family protein [Amycolatopsis anabasis]
MSARFRIAALAVLVTVLSGCGVSFQNLPIGRNPDGDSYPITLVFANAANLPIGGQVKLGQSVVGRVSDLAAKDFQALVTVRMTRDVRLPIGTKAELRVTSALGEEFVNLEVPPGTPSGYLAEGATIGVRDTATGPNVEDLLAATGTMLNGAGLDQVKTIVAETNTALAGREQTVRDMFGELNGLLGSIDARRGELTRTLDALNSLTTTVNNERSTIEAGLTRLTPAIQVLLDQRGSFEQLLGRVTTLSRTTTEVLGKTQDKLVTEVRKLRPVLDELGSFDRTLGDTLAKVEPMSKLFARAIPGDYLDMDGTVDVPNTLLSLLGLPGALLGGTPPPPRDLNDFLARGTR